MTFIVLSWIFLCSVATASLASAQSTGSHPPANAAGILNSLPPDLYRKLMQLSQLIDQHIKAGRLSDAQIQQQLMSGNLEQTIRSLGPEADRLFDEISADMKNGIGPGQDALMALLGGLGGMDR
ncbi:MAG: hypothetical protein ACM34B_11705 [Nitrospira sp.]